MHRYVLSLFGLLLLLGCQAKSGPSQVQTQRRRRKSCKSPIKTPLPYFEAAINAYKPEP